MESEQRETSSTLFALATLEMSEIELTDISDVIRTERKRRKEVLDFGKDPHSLDANEGLKEKRREDSVT